MNFDTAFSKLLGHEGGYVNHALDPGGKTKYGVTEEVAREVGWRGDMQDLPLDLAKRIYRARYWDEVRAEDLPGAVRYPVFDAAVNSGPRQSIKWLQRAVGAQDDGIIGPKTLAAVNAKDGQAVAANMLGQRLQFMTGLPTWNTFGKGWARRIADLLMGVA